MENGICAIIVTYQIRKDLHKCLDSVKDQVQETVIVDNGSDDQTLLVLKEIERTASNVKVFYNGDNLGIAAALNIGVKYAINRKYEWVLAMDHDSEAAPDMVENLLKVRDGLTGRGVKKLAIMAATIIDKNVPNHPPPYEPFGITEVSRCISSGSLINCTVFKEVGFFNESLFIYYVDDDFCLRCADHDWKIYVCRSATLFHHEGAREIKKFLWKKFIFRNYNFSARYYMSRNAVYMLKRHFRNRECFYGVLKRLCGDAVTTILFGKNRIRLLCFTIKGLFDGIIGRYGKLDPYYENK